MRRAVAVARRAALASGALTLSASLILTAAGVAMASDAQPSPSATPSASPTATGQSAASTAATRTTKARNVPAYPAKSRVQGKRIVYDKALMTIWLINEAEQVVARYPVVGRPDRPASGTYRVFSKSPSSANRLQELTFKNMVRFARGPSTGAPIGFHDIPRTYDGQPIHGEDVLGLPLGSGGCIRMSTDASKQVYEFAGIGTAVEVLAPTAP